MINPADEVQSEIPIIIMMLSWGFYHQNSIKLPPLQPNDWLYEHHKDKGETKWEIYAWAVRDAMCEASGLKPIDQPVREKLAYAKYMYGNAKDWKYKSK